MYTNICIYIFQYHTACENAGDFTDIFLRESVSQYVYACMYVCEWISIPLSYVCVCVRERDYRLSLM